MLVSLIEMNRPVRVLEADVKEACAKNGIAYSNLILKDSSNKMVSADGSQICVSFF
jgi:hypothetical protein